MVESLRVRLCASLCALLTWPLSAHAAPEAEGTPVGSPTLTDSAPSTSRLLEPKKYELTLPQGQKVCLRIVPRTDGKHALVLSGERAPDVCFELVRGPGDVSVLVAENRSGRGILFDVAWRTQGVMLEPAERVELMLGLLIDKVNVVDLHIVPHSGELNVPRGSLLGVSRVEAGDFLVGTTFEFPEVGVRQLQFSSLDDALEKSGYEAPSDVFIPWAFGFAAQVNRLRIGVTFEFGGLAMEHTATGTESDVSFWATMFDIGYDFRPAPLWHVYPFAGVSRTSVTFSVPRAAPPLVPEAFDGSVTPATLVHDATTFPLGVDVENYLHITSEGEHSYGGFFWGFRAGYAFQLAEGDWVIESGGEKRAVSGPSFDLGGPFVYLNLGFGLRAGTALP